MPHNEQPGDDERAGLLRLLESFQADPASPHPSDVQQAIHLARLLQARASDLQTPQERKQQTELDRMIRNPRDKTTMIQMTDQAFRSNVAHRVSDQLIHILDVQGVPRFFSPVDRTLLKGFQSFGAYLPGVAVPLVKEKMHHETANVVLPAEDEPLIEHLRARRSAGVRMNVNYLGEALLGEREARNRLNGYLHALQIAEVEVISVKISTLFSQISSLARKDTIRILCDRMELLYRAAAKNRFVRADGKEVPKFVYLDMEEYRDMSITSEVFMRTLDREGLENISAGIALQAYIPDAFLAQNRITTWARDRVTAGGAPVTIRIVKGANMEMERVEASVKGWPQAPYKTKIETDANFKRMLQEGMRPENLEAVRLGVASHNLFDLAYGLVLATKNEAHRDSGTGETGSNVTLPPVQFEMLEGMANHQRRALFEFTGDLLLYAPACKKADFICAIGYLIRRMDENTGPDNFLRHAFKLDVGSEEWNRLEEGFAASFEKINLLPASPRRTQDRRQIPKPAIRASAPWTDFLNEPDTDFALPHHAAWAQEKIIDQWRDRCGDAATDIPLVIDGTSLTGNRPTVASFDPSRPGSVVGRYRRASSEDLARAVACAANDADGWRTLSPRERSALLARVAAEIRSARAALMGAALTDAGKTLLESDPEVSEAVDFVEFYRRSADSFHGLDTLDAAGCGVVVVAAPWNFPIAIPCGGIAAALAAGNTVILKPASETVLVAWELCQCFWRAGISQKVLQFTPCTGGGAGFHLVSNPRVDSVILTGGTDTAFELLRRKPGLKLFAETGGKNATIITALADRDQAIKHVVHSAFSHSGQKCSATSLLILEREVYEDAHFKSALCDAVESLPVGSAWDPKTRVGPLIHAPRGDLARGLKELEEGESWALMPGTRDDNPGLYSPAIKWGVRPGSFTHLTELFGPVLGVMAADNLDHAIDLANETGYGLTSGLESLDDREQELWTKRVRAGNLYVNRPTTGAIVLRQPFGGIGKSAIGPGIKTGGPNYVAQFMRFSNRLEPNRSAFLADPGLEALRDALVDEARTGISGLEERDIIWTMAAMASYDRNVRVEFGVSHDHFRLVGQDNLRRYRAVREIRVRVHTGDTPFEILARVCAAKAAGCRITLSLPPGIHAPAVDFLEEHTEPWAGAIEFVEETDDALTEVIRARDTERIRYAARDRVTPRVRAAAAETGFYIADTPVLMEGRVELLQYFIEQSVSTDYHRYGNLGPRAEEERAEVL